MSTEAERELWRRAWGQKPLATSVGRCVACGRVYGVKDGRLNTHSDGQTGLRCKGVVVEEVKPL